MQDRIAGGKLVPAFLLVEDSPEHVLVKAAGVEIGWDGLELIL